MKSVTFRTLPLGFFASIALAGRSYATDLEDSAHVADARLETRILANLYGDPRLRAFDISVLVVGSDVVLAGIVDDDSSRKMAVQIAADQPGIGSVTNHIVVGGALTH